MQTALVLLLIMAFLSFSVQAGKFYTSANKKSYYVEPSYKYKWFESHIECHRRNMTLFTIENEDSFYDLYNVLISGQFSHKPPHLWVGAVGAQREFTWIANGKPVTWKYNSFNNFENVENCLQFFENTKDLNDRNCMHSLGFVCEENKYAAQSERIIQADKHIVFNIHQHSQDLN